MVIRVLCFRTPSSGLNRLSTKVDYLFHIFDYDHFDLSMPKLINSIALNFIIFIFSHCSRAWKLFNGIQLIPTKFIFLANTLVDNINFTITASLLRITIVKCCKKYSCFFATTAYLIAK